MLLCCYVVLYCCCCFLMLRTYLLTHTLISHRTSQKEKDLKTFAEVFRFKTKYDNYIRSLNMSSNSKYILTSNEGVFVARAFICFVSFRTLRFVSFHFPFVVLHCEINWQQFGSFPVRFVSNVIVFLLFSAETVVNLYTIKGQLLHTLDTKQVNNNM